jgi:hypothetical protein
VINDGKVCGVVQEPLGRDLRNDTRVAEFAPLWCESICGVECRIFDLLRDGWKLALPTKDGVSRLAPNHSTLLAMDLVFVKRYLVPENGKLSRTIIYKGIACRIMSSQLDNTNCGLQTPVLIVSECVDRFKMYAGYYLCMHESLMSLLHYHATGPMADYFDRMDRICERFEDIDLSDLPGLTD